MPPLIATVLIAVSTLSMTADDFFEAFSAKRDRIQTVQANFIQESETPDETLRAAGTIVYQKPRRIVMRFLDPEVVYIFDNLTYYEFDPSLEQVQILDLEDDAQAEALFLGFGSDTARLREAYEVTVIEPEAGACGTIAARLDPIPTAEGTSDGALFEHVELTMRESDYLPCAIRIVNDDQTETLYTISDIRVNEPLGSDQTQILVPQGTTIVKDEAVFETVGDGGKRLPESAAPGGPSEPPTKP